MRQLILTICIVLILSGCSHVKKNRRSEISLKGNWDIAETDNPQTPPEEFTGKAPIPGLIDMATIKFDSIGLISQPRFYWYRTTFSMNHEGYEKVLLKINKAKYHTKVFVNRTLAGENPYCFTPVTIDIKNYLEEEREDNELIIGVGTYHNLPDSVLNGFDFEKIRYIPGIYDDVKLILTNTPYIKNIQVVPDIYAQKAGVYAYIETDNMVKDIKLSYTLREHKSGQTVAHGVRQFQHIPTYKVDTFHFDIDIPGCHFWSPEDPFLYELSMGTGRDDKTINFGMREFHFDPISKRSILNGQIYYMRGTNVCIFRFFEDPDRGALPWDRDWVKELHEKFKSMHWNSIRYCIGFPPEVWYEIADEVGFLIQDEFPIWSGDRIHSESSNTGSSQIANEYRGWITERWNHPCVVIWDGQNETINSKTGEAISMVRNMDLSNRPWENGWSMPVAEADPIETHPYLFVEWLRRENLTADPEKRQNFMKIYCDTIRIPGNSANERQPPPGGGRYPNPLIINEYGWLWLNRDGSTTTLTDNVYKTLFPYAVSPEERFEVYARYLAMLSEYWRANRQCAGVLHFCGLAYSRPNEPRGQTSDHFIDIQNLVYEPNFEKYVKSAFAPVGIMIDKWESNFKVNTEISIPIVMINDTYDDFSDKLNLYTIYNGDSINLLNETIIVKALGQERYNFNITFDESGSYDLIGEISYKEEPVRSIRGITVSK